MARVSDSSWDWPGVVGIMCPAIAIPVLGLQISDMAYLSALSHHGPYHRLVLDVADWIPIPFLFWSAFLCTRKGLQGLMLLAFVILVDLMILFNFKADHIKTGTFDYFEMSYWPWVRLILIAFGAGGLAGLVFWRPRPVRPINWSMWVWPLVVFACGIGSWFESRYHPTTPWSAFAPTRSYAYLSIGFVLAGLCFFGLKAERGLE